MCEMCQKGWPNLCGNSPAVASNPVVIATETEVTQMAGLGTFGSYTVVPEVAAVPIDKDIPFPKRRWSVAV